MDAQYIKQHIEVLTAKIRKLTMEIYERIEAHGYETGLQSKIEFRDILIHERQVLLNEQTFLGKWFG